MPRKFASAMTEETPSVSMLFPTRTRMIKQSPSLHAPNLAFYAIASV